MTDARRTQEQTDELKALRFAELPREPKEQTDEGAASVQGGVELSFPELTYANVLVNA